MRGLDFVAFDVETANARRGSVCALGVAVVRDGRLVGTHSWLCRPPEPLDHFDPHNVAIHGITPEHVAGQPSFQHCLGEALDVIGDQPVVAHNAAFDTAAVREGCDAEGLMWPTLRYGCTLVWSRRELKGLTNHRLPTVAAALDVPLDRHHEAAADAEVCAGILVGLAGRRGSRTVEDFAVATGTRLGFVGTDTWQGCRTVSGGRGGGGGFREELTAPAVNTAADPEHPLCGGVVVVTGSLSVSRQRAWDLAAECGATPNKDVTKRSTHLVVGDGFTGDLSSGFTTGKVAKALRRREKGQRLEILTEAEFTALVTGERSSSVTEVGPSASP
ncbi:MULTISPECIES: exonuclease domain-containing protein [unclassified Actinopolyspora]|uniref:exonuclease domain-containing protein n=1 Tax=unclassified Actinopolyspora TaxID=2639451 RepID=UPI0013F59EC8|nr:MULTISPECIES: exonuclease domain-containing protein [unclassified Actinopolyspora]NHD15891.1 hypothetical protein [Actinopolyspora sp. BKK2]NHE74895.1 hypothetical protein [Actinopolyspora sp. BKK1]